MDGTSFGSFEPATAIEGPRGPQGTAWSPDGRRIVRRKFGAVAKLLWRKPAAEIAFLGKVKLRTAKRILRGEADVPALVAAAALTEMLREQD
jgi:hypothetical protein